MFEHPFQAIAKGIDIIRPKKDRIREWMPVIALAVVLALAPLALYLSGAIYHLVHKVNPAKASLFSWLDYFLADPADRKKQYLSLFAGLLTTYCLIPFSIYLTTEKRRELHGSARFANNNEIRQAGLVLVGPNQQPPAGGIVVGKHGGRMVCFTGQQFVILAAPTRSGKGVGVVVPNCLVWTESLVVLDIKQENFGYTSGYRQKVLGQEVYLFNPFAEETSKSGAPLPKTHRWNPFDNISKGVFRVGEVMNLGRSFWPITGSKEDFWNDLALNLFLGITLFLFELQEQRIKEGSDSELPSYPVSIGEVLRQSAGRGSGQPIKKYLSGLVTQHDWLSGECRDSISDFLSSSDDVLASIMSTFKAPLGIWRNPIVDAATSVSDFDLNDVRKKRMTVYIGVKPNQLGNAAKIINLLFSQLVNINTKELPTSKSNPAGNPALKYSCLLLMDEFTAIGKVPIIAKAVSYIAGYNLRLLPIIQAPSQLESVYGKEDAATLMANHAMQIAYAPREQKDAAAYSEMLGYFTEKSTSISRPKGAMGGGKSGPSESVSDQRRALLLPQEVKELGMWKEIIFLENTKPILCDKIKYFEDDFFNQRLLPATVIAPLDIDGFIAKTQNRHREISSDDVDAQNERIAENRRDQLLAMAECELPPDTASDADWVSFGMEFAQANSPITADERQAITTKFMDMLETAEQVEIAIEHSSAEAARNDINHMSYALSALDALGDDDVASEDFAIAEPALDEDYIDTGFAGIAPDTHLLTPEEFTMESHPTPPASADQPDESIGVGGTPITEADMPESEMSEDYIPEPEAS